MKWRSKTHSHQPQQQPPAPPPEEQPPRRHSSSSSSFLSRAFIPNTWISKIKQTLGSSKPKSHPLDHHRNENQKPNSEPAKHRTVPVIKTCGGARARQPLSSVSDHLSFVINTTFPEELPRHSYCGDEDIHLYMASRREQSIAGGGRARRIGGSFGSSRSGLAGSDIPTLSSCRSCRSDFGRCEPAAKLPAGEPTATTTDRRSRGRAETELFGSGLKPVQTREAVDPSSNPRRSLSFSGRVRRRSKKVKVHSPRVRRRKSGGGGGGRRKSLESFAVVKCSMDPPRDFRESMVEMIMENEMGRPEELERLLACYLSLNSDEYHDVIVKVFRQVWFELSRGRTAAVTERRDGDLCRF